MHLKKIFQPQVFVRHWSNQPKVDYVQGQSPSPKIREYFYYIDHHGQLFLDDSRMKNFTSCFKEKDFLTFFFKRLRKNETGRYENFFPWMSLCGRERNFIRCEDIPIVFTSVGIDEKKEWLIPNNCGPQLSVRLQPEKLLMWLPNGRIYHPAPKEFGGVGLMKWSIGEEFSIDFVWENPDSEAPTSFFRHGRQYHLDNSLLEVLEKLKKEEE